MRKKRKGPTRPYLRRKSREAPSATPASRALSKAKFGSSSLVSCITFAVKTFTAGTQSRLNFVVMPNSIRHVT